MPQGSTLFRISVVGFYLPYISCVGQLNRSVVVSLVIPMTSIDRS